MNDHPSKVAEAIAVAEKLTQLCDQISFSP